MIANLTRNATLQWVVLRAFPPEGSAYLRNSSPRLSLSRWRDQTTMARGSQISISLVAWVLPHKHLCSSTWQGSDQKISLLAMHGPNTALDNMLITCPSRLPLYPAGVWESSCPVPGSSTLWEKQMKPIKICAYNGYYHDFAVQLRSALGAHPHIYFPTCLSLSPTSRQTSWRSSFGTLDKFFWPDFC